MAKCDTDRATGCKRQARWYGYRKVWNHDNPLYFGSYCEKHAVQETSDNRVYLRPMPGYAETVR